jgi:two-component system, chemotaxis family, chemotaxis protein CheY
MRKADISVLIVDDLEFMRSAIREIIESHGFRVSGEAADGRAGVRAYRRLSPDVVLMDITMPVLDGITALAKIMDLDEKARVIMCSAMDQREYIIRAIRLGARDFIVKPFRPERILSAIEKSVNPR